MCFFYFVCKDDTTQNTVYVTPVMVFNSKWI